MYQHILQLNKDKTEVNALETKMKFSRWMQTLRLGVKKQNQVMNLGVILELDL